MSIIFSCGTLKDLGKQGDIKVAEDGYRRMVVGAFDADTYGGIHYVFNKAKMILQKGSTFRRKITKGQLYGEVCHPKRHGLKPSEYFQRYHDIDERFHCIHIADVLPETTTVKNQFGKNIVLVHADIIPSGPYADQHEVSLNNRRINTAYSIRSIADEKFCQGTLIRDVKNIITWDATGEQGERHACKYGVPAMESFDGVPITREICDAFEHNIRLPAQFAQEDIDEATFALDLVRTEAGWLPVERVDIPSMRW